MNVTFPSGKQVAFPSVEEAYAGIVLSSTLAEQLKDGAWWTPAALRASQLLFKNEIVTRQWLMALHDAVSAGVSLPAADASVCNVYDSVMDLVEILLDKDHTEPVKQRVLMNWDVQIRSEEDRVHALRLLSQLADPPTIRTVEVFHCGHWLLAEVVDDVDVERDILSPQSRYQQTLRVARQVVQAIDF